MGGYMHLVDGKRVLTPFEYEHEYISGYVTDTRLMGVVCLYMRWLIRMPAGKDGYQEEDVLHQFYYYEAEETGIESYHNITGADEEELSIVEQSLIGGLGGGRIALTEKEAVFTLQKFAQTNSRKGTELPEGLPEFQYLLDVAVDISKEEIRNLEDKMFVSIETDYQAVNYFLMRLFGKDFEALSYLVKEKACVDIYAYDEYPLASFEKNTIEITAEGTYLNQSIISDETGYRLVTSEVEVDGDRKVTDFRLLTVSRISDWEASMNLAKPEYITSYDIISDPIEFEAQLLSISVNMVVGNVDDERRIFMAFRPHNDHVDRPVYRLSDDVYGVYHVTGAGQLVIVGYQGDEIISIEKELAASPLGESLIMTGRYSFNEPVFYDFLQGDVDDFEEFVDMISLG